MPPLLGMFLSIGAVFGLLAAASAYAIAYHEYRQRMLRPDQDAARMAMQSAVVTLVFVMLASLVLYFVLRPDGQ